MPINVDGTSFKNYQPLINVNGTAIQQINVNDKIVWLKDPYPVGTTILSDSWSNGSNISRFITWGTSFPMAFDVLPHYTAGAGNPDTIVEFTLAPGFKITSFSQAQLGSGSAPYTGGKWGFWVGATVSGIYNYNAYSVPGTGSGNGGSSVVVKYVGL